MNIVIIKEYLQTAETARTANTARTMNALVILVKAVLCLTVWIEALTV